MNDKKRLWFLLFFITLVFPALLFVEADPDLWWHLRLGLDMIAAQAIPRIDTYSYGDTVKSWIDHEWLAEALFALAYNLSHSHGLIFLRDLLYSAVVISLSWIMLQLSRSFIITGILLLFCAPFFQLLCNLRPHLFSWAFSLLLIICLHSSHRDRRKVYLYLAALFVLWANLHGGFILAPVILLSVLAEDLLYSKSPGEVKFHMALFLLSFCTMFINPYGYKLFEYLHRELSFENQYISEWRSISSAQAAILLPWIIAALILNLQTRSRLRNARYLFLMLIFGAATIIHSRFVLLYVIFASLHIADRFFSVADGASSDARWLPLLNSPMAIATLAIITSLCGVISVKDNIRSKKLGVVVDSGFYPVDSVEYIGTHSNASKIALPIHWGGYVMWHLGPLTKVSIDGRNITLYEGSYIDRVMKGYQYGSIKDFAPKPGTDLILSESQGEISKSLFSSKDWKVLYSDSTSSAFVPLNKEPQVSNARSVALRGAWIQFP